MRNCFSRVSRRSIPYVKHFTGEITCNFEAEVFYILITVQVIKHLFFVVSLYEFMSTEDISTDLCRRCLTLTKS